MRHTMLYKWRREGHERWVGLSVNGIYLAFVCFNNLISYTNAPASQKIARRYVGRALLPMNGSAIFAATERECKEKVQTVVKEWFAQFIPMEAV